MGQRFIAWLVNTFWVCAAVLIITIALLVSLGRYYLPLIDNFKPQLNARVGELLNAKVSTGRLLASWDEINPVAGVEQLYVFEPRDNAPELMLLSLTEAHIELDVLESLRAFAPVYRQASIEGLQFHLYKDASGRWFSPLINQGGGGTNLQALYQAADDLSVMNSQVIFHDNEQVNIVSIKQLSLLAGNDLKQSLLQIIDDVNQKPLEVVIETTGSIGSDDFTLKGYASIETLDLSPYRFLLPDNPLKSQQVGLNVWFDWNKANTFRLFGQMTGKNLNIGEYFIGDMSSQFGLLFKEERMQLFSHNVELQLNSQDISLPDFRLDITDDFKQVKLSADDFDLSLLQQIPQALPKAPAVMLEAITALKPTGHLRDIAISFNQESGRWQPVFSANALAVSVDSWRGAPAIIDATGELSHAGNHGWFVFKQVPMSLGFDKLYDAPLLLDNSSGRLGWHIGQRVTVAGLNLKAFSEYGDVYGQFVYDGRFSVNQVLTPSISLALNLDNGIAEAIDHYVPDLNIDADFRQWLRSTAAKGNLQASQLFINASTSSDKSWWPAMQLLAHGDSMAMNFEAQWPRIHDATLSLALSHRQLVGLVRQGQLYDSFLGNTTIYIDTAEPGTELSVMSSAAGSSADIMTLFQQTPLAEAINHGFDGWQSEGEYRVSLALNGRINDLDNLGVDVYSTVENARLVFDEADLQFTDVSGSIRYKNGVIESEDLQASLWGKPWQLELLTNTDKQDFIYELNGEGRVAANAVTDWLAQPLLAFTEGEFGATAKLIFADADPELKLQSDLRGLRIKAPEPVYKKAEEALPLSANIVLADTLQVDVQTDLFKLLLAVDEHTRGHVLLGSGVKEQYRLPEKNIVISGGFEHITADHWTDVVDQYLAFSQAYPAEDPVDIVIDTLTVTKLNIADSYINNLLVSGFTQGNDWTFDVSADELAGRAFWPEAKPLALDISHLLLPLPLLDNTEVVLPPEPLLPTDLLVMDVRVQGLRFEGQDYGQWQFSLRPSQHSVKVDNIMGLFSGVSVGGAEPGKGAELLWRQHETGMRTQISFAANTGNVKHVFEAYSLEPMITSDSATVNAQLFWEDDPLNWEPELLNGHLQLNLKDGQFLRTEGAPTGLLKLLGVFNFDYLARRMRLDFGDLVKEGLSYDDLEADVRLEPGLIVLPTPMHVTGPSSDFSLSGYIDLDKQTIDGDLTAVVPVSRNLPWVAALAGGLPAAAGVYVASKVFSGGFDRLSSAQYSIKGPLDEPKIKFQRLFNDKNKGMDVPQPKANKDDTEQTEAVDAELEASPAN